MLFVPLEIWKSLKLPRSWLEVTTTSKRIKSFWQLEKNKKHFNLNLYKFQFYKNNKNKIYVCHSRGLKMKQKYFQEVDWKWHLQKNKKYLKVFFVIFSKYWCKRICTCTITILLFWTKKTLILHFIIIRIGLLVN